MNVQDYIASGILEEYCLGLLSADEQAVVLKICQLYPDVKKELTAIEIAMETMAANRAIAPENDLKQKILTSLGFPDPVIKLDINNLPATHPYSNHRSWLKTLQHLIPPEPTADFFCHVLQQNESIAQMLIITKNDVPEETHNTFTESFFILKGECKCMIGENIFKLGPGDFLEIPLNEPHDIKILSPYVVAILQYQFLPAA